jgi:hypothetical protein
MTLQNEFDLVVLAMAPLEHAERVCLMSPAPFPGARRSSDGLYTLRANSVKELTKTYNIPELIVKKFLRVYLTSL